MTALLLNSGVGSRMGKLTIDQPKCMCPIGAEHTIISWQLELLRRCGVSHVVITTGPFASKLEAYVLLHAKGLQISFVHNAIYQETNYIYSMLLAKEYLKDDVFLLHGDLVLEQSVMEELLQSDTSCVAVDSSLPLPTKDFKARIADGRVEAIGTTFFGDNCYACQPAYKWLAPDFTRWMDGIEEFCEKGNLQVYAENAWNALNHQPPLYPLELHGRLCHEIDNPEDQEAVAKRFLQENLGGLL